MNILSDNKTSLILVKNLKNKNRIKNIDIIYHGIKGFLKKCELTIDKIINIMILLNYLTKALFVGSFKNYC